MGFYNTLWYYYSSAKFCLTDSVPRCFWDEQIPAALRLSRPVNYQGKPGVMFGLSLAIFSSALEGKGKKRAAEDGGEGKLPGRLDAEDVPELCSCRWLFLLGLTVL